MEVTQDQQLNPILQDGITWRVGCGDKIKFWEESRALKQAKKHPMVVVGEQDRETNLNVEASSSSSSSSGQSVSWKRLGAGKLTLRLYYFLFSFSFCFGGKCVCEK